MSLWARLFFVSNIFREQIAQNLELSAEDFQLQFGIATLENECFLAEAGVTDEAEVSVHVDLDGGKKKKKRKPHTTPKKIKHVHKKRPKSLLEYFSVDDSTGKVKRLKQESPNLPGVYMADHPDRYTCGKTGTMFYKLTADGKRLPIPKQNKVVVAAKKEDKKDDKKGAKKKGKK